MRKKTGFSLVELLVALAIFSVVLTSCFTFLGTHLRILHKLIGACEHQQIAGMVLFHLTEDVRCAKEILPSSNRQNLWLKMGNEDILYNLKNQKVCRQKNGTVNYLTVEGDIKSLTFECSANSKTAVIYLDRFTTSVSLRN